MTGISSSDRNYCEDIACTPSSVFLISYRFLHPSFCNSLLPLRALITEIRSIPFTVSDPGVAMMKIAWWRNELLRESALISRHPIVRALGKTGVLGDMDQNILSEYFSAISGLAAGEPVMNMGELMAVAEQIGGLEASLESGLCGNSLRQDLLSAMGATAFINRMLHNIELTVCNQVWLIPMDIQARYGLTIGSYKKSGTDSKLHGVIREISGVTLKKTGRRLKFPWEVSGAPGKSECMRHFMISKVIIEKRLRRLNTKPASHKLKSAGANEIFAAWRQAIRN